MSSVQRNAALIFIPHINLPFYILRSEVLHAVLFGLLLFLESRY